MNFGLVTIPVKLYSAAENHDLPLHQVHQEDGGRIRYQRVCEVCGKVIEYRDIAKAFEDPSGERVMLSDDDFASLPADRSKEISVEQFAPADQIDALLFDKGYYLEPSAQAGKAYVLLRTVLEETDRVAVVRFALRQRTQLGALRVHDDVLAVQTLRWPDEIRSMQLPEKVQNAAVQDRELAAAMTLVDTYASDFEPDQFTDEYQEQLRELIEARIEGNETIPSEEPVTEGEDAEVVDLLAALERSVARRGAKKEPAPGGKKRASSGSGGRKKSRASTSSDEDKPRHRKSG